MFKTTTSKLIALATAATLIPGGIFLAHKNSEFQKATAQYEVELAQYNSDMKWFKESSAAYQERRTDCSNTKGMVAEAGVIVDRLTTRLAVNGSLSARDQEALIRFSDHQITGRALLDAHCVGIEMMVPAEPVAPVAPSFF